MDKAFYTCNLQALARCYYDSQSWLDILRLAEYDEEHLDPSIPTVYGLDNCDLAPYLGRTRSDSIYRLSRHDMIHNILHASWAPPTLVITPATLIEYVHSALNAVGRLEHWMKEFERLCEERDRRNEDFEDRIWSHYERIRNLMEDAPGPPGMKRLRDLLAHKSLASLESTLGSKAEVRRLLTMCRDVDVNALALLESRRRGTYAQFANLVDLSNCELFVALQKQIGNNHLVQLATTGNLTLAAYRLTMPYAKPAEMPFRHLASPYIRTMIRQEEAGHQARINKLRIGQLTLEEFLHECEKVPEIKAITHAQVQGLSPDKIVGVSKRLYDSMQTWLNLIFFPYLRGLKPSETPSTQPRKKDVTFAMDWIAEKRQQVTIGRREQKKIGQELAYLVGLDSDEVVERLVPHHPEASRIVNWLRKK